jgi:hypothetical protein
MAPKKAHSKIAELDKGIHKKIGGKALSVTDKSLILLVLMRMKVLQTIHRSLMHPNQM